MQCERRASASRIAVHRPVEIVDPNGENCAVGFTRNLSESGVRARFDTSMEPGANLLVRLSLVDGQEPIEKRARIVWTAPDLYGDGIEVGLRLVDGEEGAGEDAPAEGASVSVARPRSPVRLFAGQMVEVESGGLGLEAEILDIGEVDDEGVMRITLRLRSDAAEPASEDADLYDEERWRPRPFSDAYRRVARYAGPVLRVVWQIALVVFGIAAAGARALWRRLPGRLTGRVESVWKRLDLTSRTIAIGRRSVLAVRRAAAKTAAFAHSRQARQHGE